MTTKVYQYGCGKLDNTEFTRAMRNESLRMNGLWNRLVEMSREHKGREWAAITDFDSVKQYALNYLDDSVKPKTVDLAQNLRECKEQRGDQIIMLKDCVDTVTVEIEELLKQRREARQKARAKIETPELSEKLEELFKRRKTLNKELWPMLKEWRKNHKPLLLSLMWIHQNLKYEASTSFDLYWGNSEVVLNNFKVAEMECWKKGREVRYHAFDPNKGTVNSRLKSTLTGLGCSWAELFGKSKIVRADPLPKIPEGLGRSRRRALQQTTLHFRADKAGTIVSIPVWFHRVPTGGRIKQFELAWRMDGDRVKYYFNITVVDKEAHEPVNIRKTAIGIDPGWRLDDGGIRYFAATDTDGNVIKGILPSAWIKKYDSIERSRQKMDQISTELAEKWKDKGDLLPQVAMCFEHWSPKKSASYIDMDSLILAYDPKWPESIREKVLEYKKIQKETRNRTARLMRRRKHIYRNQASLIAQGHGVVAIEKMDLAGLARYKTLASTDDALHQAARRQRQMVSLHEFFKELECQCIKHGTQLVYVDGQTTLTCSECGHTNNLPDRSLLHYSCDQCGTVHDQDFNAAKIILEQGIFERETA